MSVRAYAACCSFGSVRAERAPVAYQLSQNFKEQDPMARTPQVPPSDRGPSHTDRHPDKSEKKALEESRAPTVSKPGGFHNDPDDPTNPCEAIERTRKKLRP
jgi:hypothetical protein